MFSSSLSLQISNNMHPKVLNKIIFSFKMFMDISCNEKVNHYILYNVSNSKSILAYWSSEMLLVLNGERNANDMKETENDTN